MRYRWNRMLLKSENKQFEPNPSQSMNNTLDLLLVVAIHSQAMEVHQFPVGMVRLGQVHLVHPYRHDHPFDHVFLFVMQIIVKSLQFQQV